ncbi:MULTISPECIES: cytochrome c-type biogenesis protein [Asaia]|uniref:Cytochrome c-type biogenesis protein n=1 Tax=Asaia bogorensis TaxID=91915 RepID=A0A060QI89_9PROT|nr:MULTISPECIES: cytochrome c-type biogenesis protein [Asaia]ETC99624.1 cytochrome C biogenesis protein [Asaia sp. SF2.1]MDL2170242.1 cytochrome c-type biogenesis protein CcmH [Asaia sp. HumB]CDG38492.1 Cytochrome c heme lyase subunit CcmL [Asaia bogorensis]
MSPSGLASRSLVPAWLGVVLLTALLALTPLISGRALALDDPSEMLHDPAQEKRAAAIGAQLRCLVCQNESIEDSSAGLARDLRHVVREHVAKGESDAQIMAWMTHRYGEFIRLKPQFSMATLLLWTMPALAVAVGIGAALVMMRRKQEEPPLTEAEATRLASLLREESKP